MIRKTGSRLISEERYKKYMLVLKAEGQSERLQPATDN